MGDFRFYSFLPARHFISLNFCLQLAFYSEVESIYINVYLSAKYSSNVQDMFVLLLEITA